MNVTIDENTVKAMARGSQEAFEMLFLFYQPKLVYYLNGFIKNQELARDMAQDIFMNVWQNRSNFEEVHSFSAYVYKMGKYAVCNYFDHSQVNDNFIAGQKLKASDFFDMEESLYAQQLQELINDTVSRLTLKRKQIYTMSRVEGLSNAEIADKLQINKRTVENHLSAALSELRKIVLFCILVINVLLDKLT